MQKQRVNKDTNLYCWIWSASDYETIELNRKKFIEKKKKEYIENIKKKSKVKKVKKRRK